MAIVATLTFQFGHISGMARGHQRLSKTAQSSVLPFSRPLSQLRHTLYRNYVAPFIVFTIQGVLKKRRYITPFLLVNFITFSDKKSIPMI